VDTSTLILLLGACFLLAGTIVTIVAFVRAPTGRETKEGFVEDPPSPSEKSASAETSPGTIWNAPQ
jgi:hypothetical protein